MWTQAHTKQLGSGTRFSSSDPNMLLHVSLTFPGFSHCFASNCALFVHWAAVSCDRLHAETETQQLERG